MDLINNSHKLQEELEFREITIQKYEEMLTQQRKEIFGGK